MRGMPCWNLQFRGWVQHEQCLSSLPCWALRAYDRCDECFTVPRVCPRDIRFTQRNGRVRAVRSRILLQCERCDIIDQLFLVSRWDVQ